jgi:hypothetical protein
MLLLTKFTSHNFNIASTRVIEIRWKTSFSVQDYTQLIISMSKPGVLLPSIDSTQTCKTVTFKRPFLEAGGSV